MLININSNTVNIKLTSLTLSEYTKTFTFPTCNKAALSACEAPPG